MEIVSSNLVSCGADIEIVPLKCVSNFCFVYNGKLLSCSVLLTASGIQLQPSRVQIFVLNQLYRTGCCC